MIWWRVVVYRDSRWVTVGYMRYDYYSRSAVERELDRRPRILRRLQDLPWDVEVYRWEHTDA